MLLWASGIVPRRHTAVAQGLRVLQYHIMLRYPVRSKNSKQLKRQSIMVDKWLIRGDPCL